MKKLFTLMALACATLGVQAQGKYALQAGQGEIPAGTQVTSVPNVTLTFGVAGDAAFADPKAEPSVDGYTAFTAGNGENGKEDSGTQYSLQPTIDGTVTVAVVLNASKAFFVTEDGTALADFNGIKVDSKYYGTYTFDVTAGKTYRVYCTGSKLGFYGFELKAKEDKPDTPDTPKGETESYQAISVDAEGNISLASEFAAVVDEGGNATNVADGKSVVTIQTAHLTLEAVGGAVIANKVDENDPQANIGQDLVPGALIDEEKHFYEIASVGSWNPISWKNGNNKLDINDPEKTKLYFVMGTGNPYVEMYCEEVYTDGNPTGHFRAEYGYYKPGMETMPLVGLYYKFTPSANGTLKVLVWANKGNRNTYVINDATKEAVELKAEGYVNGKRANYDTPAIDEETGEPKVDNQGNPVYEQYQIFYNAEQIDSIHDDYIYSSYYNMVNKNTEEPGTYTDEELAAKKAECDANAELRKYVLSTGNQAFWGWISFPVEAGTSYWLFQDSSQVGFGGFDFTLDATEEPDGIQEIAAQMVKPTTGKLYNLRGQEVGDNYRGIVVKDGKKFFKK